MEVKERVLVFNDQATFNSYKAKEGQLFKIVDELQVLADASLGLNKIGSWEKYVGNPANYLVETYWTLWGEKYNPPQTDRQQLFFNTNAIGIEHLNELKRNFDRLVMELRNYAPKITKTGVKSQLKQEQFNKWLNPEKEKEYFACLELIEASKKMLEYNANAHMLLRFYDGVRLSDTSELIPDYYRFV
jgi:hypothetical protein